MENGETTESNCKYQSFSFLIYWILSANSGYIPVWLNSTAKNGLDHSNHRDYILQGSFRLDAAAAILECGCLREVGTNRKSNVHQVLESSHRSKSTIFSKATMMYFARYKDGERLPNITRPKVTKPSSRVRLLAISTWLLWQDAKGCMEQVAASNDDAGINDSLLTNACFKRKSSFW